jgi:hypothetical protein
MGCFEQATLEGPETNQHDEQRSMRLLAFSDLSHVPAATFIYLLKDCYGYDIPQNGLHVSLSIFLHPSKSTLLLILFHCEV